MNFWDVIIMILDRPRIHSPPPKCATMSAVCVIDKFDSVLHYRYVRYLYPTMDKYPVPFR